jgi:hypothetical protein
MNALNKKRILSKVTLFFSFLIVISWTLSSHPPTHIQRITASVSTLNGTTIVSAFFRLEHHYRSSQEYNEWIGNFLSEITDNLVVFTSPEEVEWLRFLRGKKPMILHVFKDIYDWPWASRYKDEFKRQHLLDDESLIRKNPDAYAIWNSKPSFMAYAAEKNDFESDYFFWVDIGSRREQTFKLSQWPNQRRVLKVFEVNPQRLLFGLIKPMNFSWDYKRLGSQYPEYGIQGTFFSGSRDAVIRFNRTFTLYFNLFISLGSFVGLDQGVFSAIMSVDSLKTQFMALDVQMKRCDIDNWFYFYHFFKNSNDGIVNCENDDNWPTAKIITWDKKSKREKKGEV